MISIFTDIFYITMKYNQELLNTFAPDATFEGKLNCYTKIQTKCNKCNAIFTNKFTVLYNCFNIYKGCFCKTCKIPLTSAKKKSTNIQKYGVENPSQHKGVKNKKKATTLQKYGVDNPFQIKEVKDKMKATNLQKYGTEYASQSEEVKEKIKATNLQKYGVEYSSQSQEVKENMKATNLQKYGVEYTFQSDEVKEKIKKRSIEKYGTENPSQNQEIRDKMASTNLERYGVKYALQSQQFQDKKTKTNLERHGVEHYLQSQQIQEKIKATCIVKYGVKYASQSKEIQDKKYPHKCNHENCGYKTKLFENLKLHIQSMHTKEGQQRQKRQEEKVNKALLNEFTYCKELGDGHPPVSHYVRERHIDFRCISDMDNKFARIDFVIGVIGGLVFLEIDEGQHKYGCEPSCDMKRMSKVMESLTISGNELPILWIRYNPDAYRVNGELKKIGKSIREKKLIQHIKSLDLTGKSLQIEYAYYDEVHKNGVSIPEVIFHEDYHPSYADVAKSISSF